MKYMGAREAERGRGIARESVYCILEECQLIHEERIECENDHFGTSHV